MVLHEQDPQARRCGRGDPVVEAPGPAPALSRRDHPLRQRGRPQGLDQVAGETAGPVVVDQAAILGREQDDGWPVVGRSGRAQGVIHKQEFGVLGQVREAGGGHALAPPGGDLADGGLGDDGIGAHHRDAALGQGSAGTSPRPGGRQLKPEFRPAPGGGIDPGPALHGRRQGPDDGEAKTRPAKADTVDPGVGLDEGLEDALPLGFGHAGSGVAHAQPDAARARRDRRDQDPALARELDGVGDIVQQDLPQPALIASDASEPRGDPPSDLQALFGGPGRGQLADPAQEVLEADVARLDLDGGGPEPGEVQQLVDQAQQVLARLPQGVHIAALLARQGCGLQQAGQAQDAVERGPELVAQAGQFLDADRGRRRGGSLQAVRKSGRSAKGWDDGSGHGLILSRLA